MTGAERADRAAADGGNVTLRSCDLDELRRFARKILKDAENARWVITCPSERSPLVCCAAHDRLVKLHEVLAEHGYVARESEPVFLAFRPLRVDEQCNGIYGARDWLESERVLLFDGDAYLVDRDRDPGDADPDDDPDGYVRAMSDHFFGRTS